MNKNFVKPKKTFKKRFINISYGINLTFRYVCEECNSKVQPKKRYSNENCRICDGDLKLTYFCNCGNLIKGREEIRKSLDCPNCGKPIPTERLDNEGEGSVIFADGKLRVNLSEQSMKNMPDIDKISLNFRGIELGTIESPSFAEFSNVEDYEESEDKVDLDLGVENEEDLENLIENSKR